jgi:hypothetical protein
MSSFKRLCLIQAKVKGNGINPGSKAAMSVKVIQMFPDTDKCVLNHFPAVLFTEKKTGNDPRYI